jgi:glycosyltransferase involved in cell wall biosynthesis
VVRILVANDGFADAGGVQSYLEAVVAGLVARGHDLAMLSLDEAPDAGVVREIAGLPRFSVSRDGTDRTLEALRRWSPDVCFSHNMSDLAVDRGLLAVAPVVKFMHGYFGTCISGMKTFGLPVAQPCSRTFGLPCIALYFPRRCGRLSLPALVHDYRWATEQRDLFDSYRAIVVASEHMRREYVRNGADSRKIHTTPLFSSRPASSDGVTGARTASVAFMGRMTTLKGGDVLIRAVAQASSRLAVPIELIMVGDGPQRAEWERLASRLNVRSTFPGWKSGEERWEWVRRSSLLAMPSVWPEPFGLVGLEAAALGIPVMAFDVGGVREWLTPGENGYLVPACPPSASALADRLAAVFEAPDQLCAMRDRAVATARRMSLERHLDRLEVILGDSGERQRADTARR